MIVMFSSPHNLDPFVKGWCDKKPCLLPDPTQICRFYMNCKVVGDGTHLLTVWMGTVSGKPASSMAMRHSMALWEPGASTVPTTRSPIACSTHPAIRNTVKTGVAAKESSISICRSMTQPFQAQACHGAHIATCEKLWIIDSNARHKLMWVGGTNGLVAGDECQYMLIDCAHSPGPGKRTVTSGSTPVCLRTATSTAHSRSSAGVSLNPPFLACIAGSVTMPGLKFTSPSRSEMVASRLYATNQAMLQFHRVCEDGQDSPHECTFFMLCDLLPCFQDPKLALLNCRTKRVRSPW